MFGHTRNQLVHPALGAEDERQQMRICYASSLEKSTLLLETRKTSGSYVEPSDQCFWAEGSDKEVSSQYLRPNLQPIYQVSDEENFTASASASAGAGIDIGVYIEASIAASVKATINHAVVKSITTAVGDSVTVTIPPKETAYAIYGVEMQAASGHLYDKTKCEGNKSDAGMDTTYTPISAGWCTWDSDESDPCPSAINS